MEEEIRKLREALAAHKREIASLSGETLALHHILFGLLFYMQRGIPDAVERALNDAANLAEAQTLAAGQAASPLHLAKALGIVESFQKSILVRKPGG